MRMPHIFLYQFRQEVQFLYLNVQLPELGRIVVHKLAERLHVNDGDHLNLRTGIAVLTA